MLGKQWLNRYATTNVRGTTIERGHIRQRKLDGVVTWYFDHVMESLPSMLQAALLLLGCALSRYLWEINIVIASVVLGTTLFGVTFYLFIVVAGVAFESCPYQTPGARAVRHVLLPTLRSAIPKSIKNSWCCRMPTKLWKLLKRPRLTKKHIINTLTALLSTFVAPVRDAWVLVRTILQPLAVPGRVMYYRWFTGTLGSSPRAHSPHDHTIALDLRCISWMLQASLSKAVQLSTLNHLAEMVEFADFNPAIFARCFEVFIGCIHISNCKVVLVQGLEPLAIASLKSLMRIFYHLLATNPTSVILGDVRRRHNRVFPIETDFTALPFSYAATTFHTWATDLRKPRRIQWDGDRPPAREHITLARYMVGAARAGHRQTQGEKVPRWILRFVIHSLSLDPIPPTSVVADCLSIVAIDLDCGVANSVALDER